MTAFRTPSFPPFTLLYPAKCEDCGQPLVAGKRVQRLPGPTFRVQHFDCEKEVDWGNLPPSLMPIHLEEIELCIQPEPRERKNNVGRH